MVNPSSSSANNKKRGLCLLSLDGGGIRGLSELIIIEELMERIKWNKQLERTPIPADYFDLIGGTSTGGLIAILLGRLRLSAAEAIKAYENLAGKVFSERKAKGKDGTFKSSKLEEAIKSVVTSHLGRNCSDTLMYEEGSANGCRAFVCAVGASDVTHASGPTLFRTYSVAKNASYNCTIWEAARATSAAPTLFKRIKIGSSSSGIEYVDAALGCNNPTKEVIAECERVFGENAQVACILSIGTGRTTSTGFSKPGLFQKWVPLELVEVLGKMATDSGRTAEEMDRKYSSISGMYYRFDVDRGLQSISLDEWERLGDVREHTSNYMKLQEIDQKIDQVVRILSGPSHNTYDASALAGFVQRTSHDFLQLNIPQKRVSHFTVRQVLFADMIQRLLSRTSSSSSSRIVVLLGMGGSGKTQLALELCRQAEENFGFIAVLWIDASSPNSVIQSYKVIAKKIQSRENESDVDGQSAISLVQDTVQKWKRRWLIIFDNYDTPSVFRDQDIRFYVPNGKNGHILFTSRHADSERLGHCIRVATMSEDESMDLLLQRSPNEDEKHDARRIASTLGYLALALDQAGAYIRARNLPLKHFISHYNKRKEVVLREIPEQWEYRRKTAAAEREILLNVYTTWELSFEQVKGEETERRKKDHFLTLAAFFDNNKISEIFFQDHYEKISPHWMDIFSTRGQWETEKYGDILAEFQKLSLIQISVKQDDGFQFSIHPVVRDWIRLRKNQDVQQKFAVEAIKALAQYIGHIVDFDSLDLDLKQEIFQHSDACIDHDQALVEVLSESNPEYQLDPEIWFAYVHVQQGRYDEAIKWSGRALTRYKEHFGPRDINTLKVMHALAQNYHLQGQEAKAVELSESVLLEYEKQLGPQHMRTLKTTQLLVLIYSDLNRYDEAEQMCKRALAVMEQRLGLQHKDTLATMRRLANVYYSRGRVDEAEKMCERVLLDMELKLGPLHFETLSAKTLMARIHNFRRRYNEAEQSCKEALAGLEKRLGSEHPSTLSIKRRLLRIRNNCQPEDNDEGKEKNRAK